VPMQIHFRSLPTLAKFGIGAGIFLIWMVFEREVIERFGIYHYMPFYRVEGVCAWDVLVFVIISGSFIYMSKRPVSEKI
jgi:hypothetical protein